MNEFSSSNAARAGLALAAASALPAAWLLRLSLRAESLPPAGIASEFELWLLLGCPAWALLWCAVALLWWKRPLPPRPLAALLIGIPLASMFAGVFADPLLSDDLWRYAWEGMVTLSGENPYVLAPSSPELADLAARFPELRARVNNPDLSAIYPPLAQIAFAAAATTGHAAIVLKLLFCACASLSVLCVHRWLRRRGLPEGRTIAFASHPLLAIEIGYSGHLDAMLLLAVAATILAAESARAKPARSAIAASCSLAAAVLTKLAPLALLPHLLVHLRRWKHRAAAAFAVVGLVALAYAPFASAGHDLFSTLGTYNRNWEFNGPINRGFVSAWYAIDPDGAFLMTPFDAAGRALGIESAGDRLLASKGYAPIHPAVFLARVSAALLFAAAWLWMLLRRRPFHEQWLVVVGAGLLLSPVVHPWYLLALLPAAFAGGSASAAVLWWSLTIPLTYAVLPQWWTESVWKLPTWTIVIQYGGIAAVGAWAVFSARKPSGGNSTLP